MEVSMRSSRAHVVVIVAMCGVVGLAGRVAAGPITLQRGTGLGVTKPAGTFVGSTLTSFTFEVSPTLSGIKEQDTVSIQFTDSSGAAIGAPVSATVGAGFIVSVPTIPAGASGLGNKAVVTFVEPDTGTTFTSKPLLWYDSKWTWTGPEVIVDPIGLPGVTPNQTWFIDDPSARLQRLSGALDVIDTALVVDSEFNLSYTSVGPGIYEAYVTGTDGFILLDNDTRLSLQNGMLFGTIQHSGSHSPSSMGINAIGTFDFSAIGLKGDWSWDAGSDYTSGEGTGSPFNRAAISVAPEPDTVLLLACGLLGLVACRHSFSGTH
jgi:hypothetical protein